MLFQVSSMGWLVGNCFSKGTVSRTGMKIHLEMIIFWLQLCSCVFIQCVPLFPCADHIVTPCKIWDPCNQHSYSRRFQLVVEQLSLQNTTSHTTAGATAKTQSGALLPTICSSIPNLVKISCNASWIFWLFVNPTVDTTPSLYSMLLKDLILCKESVSGLLCYIRNLWIGFRHHILCCHHLSWQLTWLLLAHCPTTWYSSFPSRANLLSLAA